MSRDSTYAVYAVANYIIRKYEQMRTEDKNIEKLTLQKLQKVLYFSNIAYMKTYKKAMIEDKFYLWESGPVIPKLFLDYLDFFPRYEIYNNLLTYKMKRVINGVLEKTKYMTRDELIEKSKKYYQGYYDAIEEIDTEIEKLKEQKEDLIKSLNEKLENENIIRNNINDDELLM